MSFHRHFTAKRKVPTTETDSRNVASKSVEGSTATTAAGVATGAGAASKSAPQVAKPNAAATVPAAGPSLFAEYDSD